MTIDWSAFTPGSAAIGGAVLGLAAALLVLLDGRVARISGIEFTMSDATGASPPC
jgi:uncharacterized protein